MPCWHNRCRHLPTVSSQTPRVRPIAALDAPSAAASTIRARTTSRCSPLTRPARASSRRRPSQRTIRSELDIAIHRLSPGARRCRQRHAGHRYEHHGHRAHTPGVDQDLVAATATSQGQRPLATAVRPDHPPPRRVRLHRRAPARRHRTATVPPALRRLSQQLGFAIHLASRNGYENTVLPSGYPVGTSEEALDCGCGLYLNDPTAWTNPRRTNGRDHSLLGEFRITIQDLLEGLFKSWTIRV